jgi:hypothetical protein
VRLSSEISKLFNFVRRRETAVIAVPMFVLTLSIALHPFTFVSNARETPLLAGGSQPQFLSRNGDLTIWYTSDDLLYPPFSTPQSRSSAVIFEVPAVLPNSPNPLQLNLIWRWITQIHNAIALRDGLGVLLSDVRSSEHDSRLAYEFSRTMYLLTLRPGGISFYELAVDAGYRKHFGVRAFIPIAIKSYRESGPTADPQSPQTTFNKAISAALTECRKRGIDSIAIPFFDLTPEGQKFDRQIVWRGILRTTMDLAPKYGVANVVFGGRAYTDIRNGRTPVDREFEAALFDETRDLRNAPATLADETVRLSALACLAAAVKLVRSQHPLSLSRVVAYQLAAASVATAVITLLGSGDSFGLATYPILLLSAKTCLVLLAGYFIAEVSRLLKAEPHQNDPTPPNLQSK